MKKLLSVCLVLIMIAVTFSGCLGREDGDDGGIISAISGFAGDFGRMNFPIKITYEVIQTSTAVDLYKEEVTWQDQFDLPVTYSYTGAYNNQSVWFKVTLEPLSNANPVDDDNDDGIPDLTEVLLSEAEDRVKGSLPGSVGGFKFGAGSLSGIVGERLGVFDQSGDSLELPFRSGAENVTRGAGELRPFGFMSQNIPYFGDGDDTVKYIPVFVKPRISMTIRNPTTGNIIKNFEIPSLDIPVPVPYKPDLPKGDEFNVVKSHTLTIPLFTPLKDIREGFLTVGMQDSTEEGQFWFFRKRATTVWEDAWNIFAGATKWLTGGFVSAVTFGKYGDTMEQEGLEQFAVGCVGLYWRMNPVAEKRAEMSGTVWMYRQVIKTSASSYDYNIAGGE